MKDDLDQLLEAEHRLASRFEEAQAAAARLLEIARADAHLLDRRAEEDVKTGLARIAQETQTELESELMRIEARADQRVLTYTGVSGDQLRDLSYFVLRALLEDAAAVQK